MSRTCLRQLAYLKFVKPLGPSLNLLARLAMNGKQPAEAASPDEPAAKRPYVELDRVKRKKVAMLVAYSGQGYFGMQRNPGTKTIEEDLLSALLSAGHITDEAFATAQTIQFQRAARTDKGVSAARQIVSLKLPEEAEVESVNAFLPPTIRVLALRRTTKGFNCKSSCDARTYSYLMPSMALSPADPDPTYRADPGHLEAFRATLRLFHGTHNFHNFTSKKQPGDPSALRYIMSFECSQPFTVDPAELNPFPTEPIAAEPEGEEPLSAVQGPLEMVEVRVKGQSFMLHQIRKMVGLAVAVARGLADAETVARAFRAERIDIPVAPGLGLVLEQVHYERYNQRYGADGIHQALDWTALDDQVEHFKRKYIHPAIVVAETTHQPMRRWLLTLPLHTYGVRHRHLHQAGAAEQVDNEGGQQVGPKDGQQVDNEGGQQVGPKDGQQVENEDGQQVEPKDGQQLGPKDGQQTDNEDGQQVGLKDG